LSVLKEKISSYFENRLETLIIGGTGTLGRALLELIGKNKRYRITVLSREEIKQKELMALYPDVSFVIGDIRDRDSLERVFIGKEVVFHFAAMKHVEMAEANPEESIKINLLGSLNVAKEALKNHVQHCVFSSTDKAVLPINNYGMCKALSENYFLSLNETQEFTKFSVFRWGNVLGSRGSVIHSFVKSLREKNSVNITDAKMTRFWIDIRDAAKFILDNYENAQPHLAMIPEMKSCRILRIAELCAKHLDIKDYKVNFTGVRAGEKIHETLWSSHEMCMRSDTTEEYSDDELLDMIEAVVD
jgi:UDP-N-acetylglucosamine 4,6-dehydratase